MKTVSGILELFHADGQIGCDAQSFRNKHQTDMLCLEYGTTLVMKAIYSLKNASAYMFLSENPFRAVLSEVRAGPDMVVLTEFLLYGSETLLEHSGHCLHRILYILPTNCICVSYCGV
jgi:hypothetical protein